MSFQFDKDKARVFNYYTCKTCNDLNWVCEDCSKGCHNGHDLLPHMIHHLATWACCYCVKKKCCLPNKKNKGVC